MGLAVADEPAAAAYATAAHVIPLTTVLNPGVPSHMADNPPLELDFKLKEGELPAVDGEAHVVSAPGTGVSGAPRVIRRSSGAGYANGDRRKSRRRREQQNACDAHGRSTIRVGGEAQTVDDAKHLRSAGSGGSLSKRDVQLKRTVDHPEKDAVGRNDPALPKGQVIPIEREMGGSRRKVGAVEEVWPPNRAPARAEIDQIDEGTVGRKVLLRITGVSAVAAVLGRIRGEEQAILGIGPWAAGDEVPARPVTDAYATTQLGPRWVGQAPCCGCRGASAPTAAKKKAGYEDDSARGEDAKPPVHGHAPIIPRPGAGCGRTGLC
jgi:hypothetical protein